ncbi:iron-containing alcohol dehydrogenase [Halieaceae bacterium IMCC14734]|uniref:Iron-containing alcohol dehydrogenase n=1 Tax=Candidatus Litorirhabdus singularis TaxID=2518993 RepID=A0ABT3TIU3_9GAMM|nr:iron-containing alcohol dehydrogenase [Candidatus Litorirhabdus singularis]
MLQANWNYPTAISVGAGRLAEVAAACVTLGINRPLLVTDPGVLALPFAQTLVALCSSSANGAGVFSDIKSNPTAASVEAGAAQFRSGKHDGVIALGGGSALDCGKTIAALAPQSGTLWQQQDSDGNWSGFDKVAAAPIIAIPTTAGTGSEVGRAAVVTDPEIQLKKIVWHPGMLPTLVILDPELTVGLPAGLTAATGMDALSHNLEALCAPGYHPMAEGIGLQGMRLVKDNLLTAVEQGGDLTARTNMLVASSMGATAFQRGLGGMHALAHSLGAVYDAHHGVLNAILMPYVLKANEAAIGDTMHLIASSLGLPGTGFSAVMEWVLSLREQTGIAHSLAEIGIVDDESARIGAMAAVDSTAATNPILHSADTYSRIFEQACRGQL